MRIHKYYKMVRVDYEDEGLFEISNITSTAGTITVNNTDAGSQNTLQYSTDGVNWTTAVLTGGTCQITLPANGNCYFKGNDFRRRNGTNNAMFDCDVDFIVKGNLYSLIDPVNYASATQSYDFAFYRLFIGSTHLIDAGGLMLPVGVTSIGNNGLYSAFEGCSKLTTAPDLSNVTSIGNFGLYYAFNDCSRLTTAPDLSNVTSIGNSGLYYAFNDCSRLTTAPDLSGVTSIGDSGLFNAFGGCTSLTTAPDFSNLTSIGNNGLYSAFEGCSKLTTAPDLSNVTSIGNSGLYYAFNGCTSLTTAPDLSNVTSIGDSGLYYAFGGCTSLTTAPDLSNVTSIGDSCFYRAFVSCFKLETIYVPNVDTWGTSIFNNWVQAAGSSAATPKQMIFQSQALLDLCPSGNSGYGDYTKVLA